MTFASTSKDSGGSGNASRELGRSRFPGRSSGGLGARPFRKAVRWPAPEDTKGPSKLWAVRSRDGAKSRPKVTSLVVAASISVFGLSGLVTATAPNVVTLPGTSLISDDQGDLAVIAGIPGSRGEMTPGPATSSELYLPFGVAADSAGNVYIGDTSDATVDRVTPAGQISVWAGVLGDGGLPTPGPATSSELDVPYGIGADSAGDVYIADDSGNHVVEKVTPSGQLSVVAGIAGRYGPPTAGPATSSLLYQPTDVAVDSAGDFYIADAANNCVEKVTASGQLSVVAGICGNVGQPTPGPATSSLLNTPMYLAVDSAGDLYISDTGNNLVEKVTPSGALSIVAGVVGHEGAPTPGPATSSDLRDPEGVAVDSAGDLFIADFENQVVEEVTPAGELSIVAGEVDEYGLPTPGPATSSELGAPVALAVDLAGDLFIANYDLAYVAEVYAVASPQDATDDVSPVGGAVVKDGFGGGSESAQCQCDTPIVAKPGGIAPGTGDLVETSEDIGVPGAAMPLGLSRTYDSGLAQNQVSTSTVPGPLGYGWSYNLGMSVSLNSSTEVATVDQENGSEVSFSPYASGSSPTWCSGATNYCADQPRTLATLEQNGGGSWTLVRYAGGDETTFDFSSAGALTSETDEAGDSLTSASESPGSGACASSAASCTVWTSSASGRSLTLAFNASGRLLSATDGSGNTVSYCYFGQSCAGGASDGGSQDLYSAELPGGATTKYGYDSSNSTAAYDHDILTEALPTGGMVTNTFNSAGQVATQDAPSGDVTLSYSGDNQAVSGGSTVVSTWPAGTSGDVAAQEVDYQYSSGALVAETTAYGTSSASTEYFDLDPTSLVPTAVQDGNEATAAATLGGDSSGDPMSAGDVTLSTDADGNTTEYQYNADNQVWCEVAPAEYLDGVSCPSTAPSAPPAPGGTDPYLGAAINFYNSSGQLTAATDALGNTTTYSYTSGVSGVPNGLEYCSVGPMAYQADVTCPAYGASHVSGTTTSTYDSAGDMTSSTDADGDTTSYVYGASGHPGLVSSETGPNGKVTTYSYNSAGEVSSQVVSFGTYSATTVYAYDADGNQYCSVAPYEYAKAVTCPSSVPSSPPTPSDDPYLGATITTYDANNEPVQVTNPLGGITYTAYDHAGNAYCTVAPAEAAAGVTCPSSPPATPPTVGDDPYLGATITTYDTSGQAVQVTSPLGGITLTTYDADGNVAQTTMESNNSTADPNVVTSYSYDPDNRVVSTTVDPGGGSLSATTLQAYDPDGNVYCSVSANAYAAGSSAYQCPPWQPGWVSSPPSPSSLYSSTPTSAQANNVTTTFYDVNGDQLQSTDPDVHTSVSVFDGDGRTYCSSDPTNVSTWLTTHSSGTYPYLCPATPPSTAPAQGSNPGYVTTIFDPAGRVLSSTDQVGDTTAYTYAPGGQVLTTTNPRGYVTTDCYYYEDTTGECAHSAPAGGGSADDLYSTNTPATSADPSGEMTDYTYYPGDQADTTTTPGGTTTDAYDANGDLTSLSYSGTASGYSAPANVSYTYNVDGTAATVADAAGTTAYGYDGAADVTSQALTATASDLSNTTTSYGYFSTGALASVTYPAYSGSSDPKVNYTYDATGAMASETDWEGDEVTFAHDGDGNETGQDNNVNGTYPDGTSSTTWYYDDADNTASAASSYACTGGTETLSQSFSGTGGSINPDDQLTQYSTSYAGACSAGTAYQRNYGYDLAGRVVYQGSAAQGSNANNFAYDAAEDPTKISSHDSSGNFDTYSQVFDGDGEVTAQSPISGSHGVSSTYTYDTLGDQTQFALTGTATTLDGYDQVGQLASATTPAALATYLYNGDGLEARDQVSSPLWGPPTTVDSTRSVHGVSCPTTSFCAAVDTSGYATVYNGSSWSSPSDIDGSHALEAVSCTSSSFCKAVDNDGEVANYSGSSWSVSSAVDSTRTINAISCPTTTFCAAVDNSGYITTYNGTSWATPADKDGSHALEAVSCTSSSFCVATDNDGNVITYNGTSWSSATSEDSTRTIHGVSCPTTSFCAAVDTSGYATTYNGTSWSTPSDIDGSHALEAVSCTSSSFCVATDNDGNVITYNGSSWSADQDIDSTRTLNAISCASPSSCTAVDASGYVMAFAVQAAWGPPTTVDSTRSVHGVSCPTTSFCAAVDTSGYATVYNGSSWSSPSDIDGSHALEAVSCTSSSFCKAVDNDGEVANYSGSSWSVSSAVDSTRTINAISCPTTTFCAAVDNSGYITTYNGTSWATPADKDGSHALEAVSCTSSSFCVATDNDGNVITYNGTSWSSATSEDSTRTIHGVSCPTTSFCAAVDTSGYATTYNGTSWSTPSDIDGSHALEAVSCTSSSFCVATDNDGNVITYNGSSWSADQDIDSTRTLNAISCASPSSCTAVDASGYGATCAWSTTTSQLTWEVTGSLPLLLSDGTYDYIYGPGTTPVEQVSLASSTPAYLTYTQADSTWLSTNATGDKTGFWGYDAFGNLAFGTATSAFGYAGQYTDATHWAVGHESTLV
jgi:YD repeat-containing protein